MPFEVTAEVRVKRDGAGVARHLAHVQEPYLAPEAGASTPLALARAYVRDVADVYGLGGELLDTVGERVTRDIRDEGSRLRFLESKAIAGAAAVAYQQTYLGLPVWEAHLTVRLRLQPLAVTSSESALHHDIAATRPARQARYLPGRRAATAQLRALVSAAKGRLTHVTAMRLLVYRHDPALRLDPESRPLDGRGLEGGAPTLPLPAVPAAIRPGRHYVVTEALFTTRLPPWRALHWRAFIEVETGAVLYLRALVASAFGNVLLADPFTLTGNAALGPCSPASALDPLATAVTLPGLTPPAPGNPQRLSGEYVALGELSAPGVAAPAAALPAGDFSYAATTDDFGAVSTYYHCDGAFRMMAGMGFDLAAYFPDTAFPLTVDHRDASFGIVNARGYGNAMGNGAGGMGYNLAQSGCPVSIAADRRVVLHEFCHELLWEHVHSAYLGFAHSAGDSLAAILLDPDSQAFDRFRTFPWIAVLLRRHNRDVSAGWAWGGTKDDRLYSSEEILSTTLFRVYRATGGDALDAGRRRFAARCAAYLIIKAIGLLTMPTTDPEVYATALMDADASTPDFEGIAGGGLHKVIRWSFEKQGLYQPPGAPTPVTSSGAPPDVDVYIDDGRQGEYHPFLGNFWGTTAIWNRLAPASGTEADHETPVVGVTNYLYVRVRNRGTQPAQNVVVRAYHCMPATGLVWPDDWQPATTAQLALAGAIAPGGDAIAGPFEWTPEVVGHECLLAAVSADGDRSNIDPLSGLPSAAGPSPHWRLVPFDNNISQRNVAPVAGGGGGLNLAASFERRRFRARNPYLRPVRLTLEAVMPDFLAQRGWALRFLNPGGASFTLGPRGERDVVLGLARGAEFEPEAVIAAGAKAVIDVIACADGIPIGGMSYAIDPRLKTPPPESRGPSGAPDQARRPRAARRAAVGTPSASQPRSA